MFSLTGAVRFRYIPNYKDMRGGYDKLVGVVRSLVGEMEEGTAYMFTSRDQKLVKIIRHEHNECQLYSQRFDHGMSFLRLSFDGVRPVYVLEWKYVVAMLSCPVIKKICAVEPSPVRNTSECPSNVLKKRKERQLDDGCNTRISLKYKQLSTSCQPLSARPYKAMADAKRCPA